MIPAPWRWPPVTRTRKSQPTPPRTVHIRWVNQNEDLDAGQRPTSDAQPQSYNPSVSEGIGVGQEPSEASEPIAAEPEPVPQAFEPVFRNADPTAPKTALRNEPTADANKDVVAPIPAFDNAEPTHPISETRNPKSNIHLEASQPEI